MTRSASETRHDTCELDTCARLVPDPPPPPWRPTDLFAHALLLAGRFGTHINVWVGTRSRRFVRILIAPCAPHPNSVLAEHDSMMLTWDLVRMGVHRTWQQSWKAFCTSTPTSFEEGRTTLEHGFVDVPHFHVARPGPKETMHAFFEGRTKQMSATTMWCVKNEGWATAAQVPSPLALRPPSPSCSPDRADRGYGRRHIALTAPRPAPILPRTLTLTCPESSSPESAALLKGAPLGERMP